MTFDGTTQRHYVDGVEQGSGAVAFLPLRAGQTSIGVRQNRVSWFKGRIHTVRVTPSVRSSSQLLKVPAAEIALWPEGVPGAPVNPAGSRIEQFVDGRISNVHVPTLTVHAPPQGTANGTAVIVCAGGSYSRLAMANEVDGITPHLTRAGVTVFVLKYRLSEYGHPAPLLDCVARRAHDPHSRAASSASGPIGSACSARLPADTWRRPPRRGSMRRRAAPAPRSTRSARGRTSWRCCIRW